jgi:hypothetical protein
VTRITDEVVEAAALAMFADEHCDKRQMLDVPGNWNSRLNDEDQALYRSMAHAALEAALPHLEGATPRKAFDVAYNIVNQLADLWEVPVDIRQATNDRCWEFAAGLIEGATPAIDREALDRLFEAHRIHYDYGADFACVCGWKPEDTSSMRYDDHRRHLIDELLTLIGGASK